MEEALATHLMAQPALTALIGSRLTWTVQPQGHDRPAVVLHVIDNLPEYVMKAPEGLSSRRIQADCWAPTFASAKAVARQVSTILSGAHMTVGGVKFQGSFKAGERDTFETGGAGEPLYRTSLDWIIWTRED